MSFNLINDATIQIEFFDNFGKIVSMPINEKMQLGVYSIPMNISKLDACLYFYHVKINGEKTETGKFIKL